MTSLSFLSSYVKYACYRCPSQLIFLQMGLLVWVSVRKWKGGAYLSCKAQRDQVGKGRSGVVPDHSVKGDYLFRILCLEPTTYYKISPDLLLCVLLCYWSEVSGYEGEGWKKDWLLIRNILNKRYWLFGSTIYLYIVKTFSVAWRIQIINLSFFVFKEKTEQQQLSPSEQPPSNNKLMCRGQWEKEIFGKEPNYLLKLKCAFKSDASAWKSVEFISWTSHFSGF